MAVPCEEKDWACGPADHCDECTFVAGRLAEYMDDIINTAAYIDEKLSDTCGLDDVLRDVAIEIFGSRIPKCSLEGTCDACQQIVDEAETRYISIVRLVAIQALADRGRPNLCESHGS